MEKSALYLKQNEKNLLNSTQSNKLGSHAGLVHPDEIENVTLGLVENKLFPGTLLDKVQKIEILSYNTVSLLIDKTAAVHLHVPNQKHY